MARKVKRVIENVCILNDSAKQENPFIKDPILIFGLIVMFVSFVFLIWIVVIKLTSVSVGFINKRDNGPVVVDGPVVIKGDK